MTLRGPENFAYEKIQRQILEYVQFNPARIDQYVKEGADPSAIVARIKRAMNCKAVFDALEVPSPQDSLDSLS
ncbi:MULTISPECIES: hypothetical protein [Ralstonia solanacearum species complex]|uniref:Uncharacterized protein n=1 Tax=Ralstonia solanacearum TaxID=305 RepID=A0A0S4WVC5_RALSL|nr:MULTISPECIES: hypothetical protein [Ralstonia]MCF1443497.1 hypothetical protein [Ralstonia solanacearum]MDC6285975.1 hypothetical protein [Ralstonia pseudosolanacearum]MDC6291757.1 hypothetical protein [Ralstonia pseudosolanacearum]MDD7787750.1 hypothetical protein [Ralstonia pseudosolanacearum]MDN3368941.1 hypothetical protein [Ralstonia pseudosolanacearum]